MTKDALYWRELNQRILRTVIFFIIALSLTFFSTDWLVSLIIVQVKQYSPDLKIVSRSLMEPFLIIFKLNICFALFFSFLWMMTELWFFIKDALTMNERKKFAKYTMIFVTMLCFLEWLTYQYVLPISISFFIEFNRNVVEKSLDLYYLIGYWIGIQCGVIFLSLWPIFLDFLIEFQIVSKSQLSLFRPYYYVGAFFLGMIMTPPDVMAQLLIAFPLILIYELSLIDISTFFQKRT